MLSDGKRARVVCILLHVHCFRLEPTPGWLDAIAMPPQRGRQSLTNLAQASLQRLASVHELDSGRQPRVQTRCTVSSAAGFVIVAWADGHPARPKDDQEEL